MKKIYLNLAALLLCMAALGACKHSSNGNATSTSTPSTFTRLFDAPNNSQPSPVQDGDAGQVSLTGQPNPVTQIP